MTRYVGIDLAKRSMRVCAVTEGSAAVERRGLKTDGKGRQMPCPFPRKGDVVAMEVCGYANTLARLLTKQAGREVRLPNPGGLATVGIRPRRSGWKCRCRAGKRKGSGRM